MLRRDDDGPHPLRDAALVLDGHLGLAVGPEVRQLAGLADLGQPARHPVGEGDRQRHQLGRLAAGEAEHHPLVAGAELERRRGVVADLERRVDALRDVGRLVLDRDERAAGLVVEAVVGARVADVADRVADDRLEVDVGVGRDLAEDEHEPGRGRRLARDARVGSSRRIASRMASEIWSHILSGWPSVTDSEVNRYCAASTMLMTRKPSMSHRRRDPSDAGTQRLEVQVPLDHEQAEDHSMGRAPSAGARLLAHPGRDRLAGRRWMRGPPVREAGQGSGSSSSAGSKPKTWPRNDSSASSVRRIAYAPRNP